MERRTTAKLHNYITAKRQNHKTKKGILKLLTQKLRFVILLK